MKVCSKCNVEKSKLEFYVMKSTTDGFKSACKVCSNKTQLDYKRTKKGLVSEIYSSQRSSCKNRGHEFPTYTLEDLRLWVYSQPNFQELYDNWVNSDYDTMLKPSCDRSDDYKGYDLNRLTLMTWQENFDKGHSDRKNGIDNRYNKAVIQSTKEGVFVNEFHSQHQAERETGVSSKTISRSCLFDTRTAGGFKWKFK